MAPHPQTVSTDTVEDSHEAAWQQLNILSLGSTTLYH